MQPHMEETKIGAHPK